MKQKSENGKFIIEVKDGFLEGGKYTRKDGIAFIKLFAEGPSVTLDEVADAIIDCTFYGRGLDKVIDSNRFHRLNIYLEIKKSEDVCVTYNFKIPNYQTTDDVLPAIACDIRI